MICAEVDGEVVALNVEMGLCYGLDPIGSRIWDMIERPVAVADLCAALTERYAVDPATCERDVLELVAELEAEDLAAITAPPPAGP